MKMFLAMAFLFVGIAQASAQELKLDVEKYKLKME